MLAEPLAKYQFSEGLLPLGHVSSKHILRHFVIQTLHVGNILRDVGQSDALSSPGMLKRGCSMHSARKEHQIFKANLRLLRCGYDEQFLFTH